MHATIHLKAIVQPGHRLEIECPQLQVGLPVEVTVVAPGQPSKAARINGFLNQAEELAARRPPVDTAEIDRQIRAERDTWD